MYRTLPGVMLVLVVAATPGVSAGADKSAPVPEDVDRLIRRLEESGALDAAIDRGIQRHIQREVQARQKQQEELQKRQAEAARNVRPVTLARDHVHGNTRAEVSVIVYTDLECPYCKRFAGTPEAAVEKFGGRANVVMRHYPLDFHGEIAKRGAYYAECVARQAGSKGFFAFVNDWFKLTATNGKGLERGDPHIWEIARAAGSSDLAALKSCATDPAVARRVQEDVVDGTRGGVTGTPGTIVRNNNTGMSVAVTGAVPAQTLEQAIAQVLQN